MSTELMLSFGSGMSYWQPAGEIHPALGLLSDGAFREARRSTLAGRGISESRLASGSVQIVYSSPICGPARLPALSKCGRPGCEGLRLRLFLVAAVLVVGLMPP